MYRDAIRRFLRGDRGVTNEVATRICGSSDLYQHQNRLPISGINFITCHDGFTLNDLFSYNEKHNFANGENNRDGCNNGFSFNCGAEGPTGDSAINALRHKLAKNAFAILLLSHGVPMLLAGDEFLHSQRGNNNCYCQDNELSWLNWHDSKRNADVLHFVRLMVQLRKRHPALMRRNFLNGKIVEGRGIPDITWHGVEPGVTTAWDNPDNQVLIFTLAAVGEQEADLHVVLNMSDDQLRLHLPWIEDRTWCLAVDTALKSPRDIVARDAQMPLEKAVYSVDARSVVVFENMANQQAEELLGQKANGFFSKLAHMKLFDHHEGN